MLVKIALVITVAAGALAMAAPALGAGAVTTVIELKPPKTSVSVHLKLHDRAVTIHGATEEYGGGNNYWLCDNKTGQGLDKSTKEVNDLLKSWNNSSEKNKNTAYIALKNDIELYADVNTLEHSSREFFELLGSNFQPLNVLLNPSQGETVTKVIQNCYSNSELDTAMIKVYDWTNYMFDVWLPAHKAGK